MIIKKCHRNKLHQELASAGVKTDCILSIDSTEFGCNIEFSEGADMNLAQQIIDTHDPTPPPSQPTAEERLKMAEETILFLLTGGM